MIRKRGSLFEIEFDDMVDLNSQDFNTELVRGRNTEPLIVTIMVFLEIVPLVGIS